MLAAKLNDLSELRYPCFGTPKIDGIRCLIIDGKAYSRSMKPIRNPHVQEMASRISAPLDGELVAPGGTFQDTTSLIMSFDGGPGFEYRVFDIVDEGAPYEERLALIVNPGSRIVPVRAELLLSKDAFLRFEDLCLAQGYEGVMTNAPKALYKRGRSTAREQALVKWKRVHEGEALILACREQMGNENEQVPDNFGYMRRPGGQAGLFAKGTLGSFEVRDISTGVEFGVGSGFDDALRARVWSDQAAYIGRVIKYRCQLHGVKDKPRFPRFVGFRDPEDMS